MAAAAYYHEDYSTGPPSSQPAVYNEMQTFKPAQSQYHAYQPLQRQRPTEAPANSSQTSRPNNPSTSPRVSRKRFESLKRGVRLVRTGTNAVSTFVNTILFAIMVYVNIKFYSTRTDENAGHHAWPQHTKIWPSIMLLLSALVTLTISMITLVGYCCRSCGRSILSWKSNSGQATTGGSWKFTVFRYVAQISIWVIVSVLYRYEKSLHGNNNDLWGWSCANKSNAVQAAFDGKLNFSGLCSMQSQSWHLSIVEPAFKILFAIAHFWLRRKVAGAKQAFANSAGDATADLLQNVF